MTTERIPMPLELFCDLLRQKIEAAFDIERCFQHLAGSNPSGCCIALRIYLDTQFDMLLNSQTESPPDAESNSFLKGYSLQREFEKITEQHLMQDVIAHTAQVVPIAFVEELLPWFVRVGTTFIDPHEREDRYPSEPFFSYQVHTFYSPKLDYAPDETTFIQALIGALQYVAKSDPTSFRAIAHELSQVESDSVQIVLARAYLGKPEEYSEDIFNYLMADARRFTLGDNDYDSCQLFKIAFTYGDDVRRATLEQYILDMIPDWEKRHRGMGYTQTLFLKSIDPQLLSRRAFLRLQELQRRFPELEPKPNAAEIRGGFVGSPISAVEIDKMSDDNLLNAMRVYDETTDWDAPRSERLRHDMRDFLVGGLVEFSRAIGEKTKEHPERFYNLTKQFDERIHVAYIGAILSGIADSPAPANWVFDVARQFANRFEGYYRIGFSNALRRRAKDYVPDDLLDIIMHWALNDPSPDPSIVSENKRLNEWMQQGINSVRGVAVEAVSDCSLGGNPKRTQRVLDLLSKSVHDPSPAVGACVLQCIGQLLGDNDERGKVLLLAETLLEKHPQLLDDLFTYRFLSWATFYYFDLFGVYIERMLNSEIEHVRQEGGRLACQAALNTNRAIPLQERVMAGDVNMRRGAAQTFAAYLPNPKWQAICEKYLRELMFDPDEEIRKHVASCFASLKPSHIETLRSFVFAYLESPALGVEPRHLIDYAKSLSIEEHDVALAVTQAVIRAIEEGHIVHFWDDDIVSLPLAVYNRSNDEATKSRAMMLFETLLRRNIHGAKDALNKWDEYRDWEKVLARA